MPNYFSGRKPDWYSGNPSSILGLGSKNKRRKAQYVYRTIFLVEKQLTRRFEYEKWHELF